MKKLLLFSGLFVSLFSYAQNNIGIGTTNPNPNAVLDIKSNSKGILIPRLNSIEQTLLTNSLTPNEQGMLLFNLDSNCFAYWLGTNWIFFPRNNSVINNQIISISNDTIFLQNGGNIKLPLNLDNDPTNEIQNISISNDTIFLQNGGNVKLPAGIVDTDDQLLSVSNDTLFIQDGNFVKLPNLINTDNQVISISNDTVFLQNGGNIKLPFNLDNDPTNEIQNISISNDTIFLQNGGNIKLPAGIVDTDDQLLSISNDTLFIQDGNFVRLPNLINTDNQVISISNDTIFLQNGGNIKLPLNLDNDPTNEIQNISISNDTIFLQNGGNVKLPAGIVDTDDQLLSISNDTLFIQDGNFVKLPNLINTDNQVISISNDTVFLQNGGNIKLPLNLDNDPTNEIQNISISNDTIFLQNGGNVKLPAGIVDTDDQLLSISNDTLFIQDGNFVKLPLTSSWELNGNTGTNSTTNFLGTTDLQDLVFKTNGIEAARVTTNGILSINNNTPVPDYKLQVVNNNDAAFAYSELGTAFYGVSDSSAGVYGYSSASPLNGAGTYGKTSHIMGTGVVGGGNNVANTFVLPQGSGGAFTGEEIGVFGIAMSNASNYSFGGFFENNGAQTYVGGWDNFNFIDYKILGTGAVSTIVKDTNNNNVVMFAPESPEIVFEDYGTGKLINGRVHVSFDKNLAKNIVVDEEHELKVFIQEEGESKGLYVTNKSAEGFDVIEKFNGASSISFSWRIVANRKNKTIIDNQGRQKEAKYEEARFPKAPNFQVILKQHQKQPSKMK